MKDRVTINRKQRLYVIPAGKGYSCLGFDVCFNRSSRLAVELGLPVTTARKGTLAVYAAYRALADEVKHRHDATGFRSTTELTPELVGLEGKRVEIIHRWPSGEIAKERFQVGRSTGWIPCHLAIARRNCHSGPVVCLGKIESVRVVS